MRNLLILLIFISAYSCKNHKQHLPKKTLKINQHDTVINLSKTRKLLFTGYKEILKEDSLYTKRLLLNADNHTIAEYTETFSTGWFSLSPNKKYIILDRIDLGYVYMSETDSILHDKYSCMLIKLNDGDIIDYIVSICGGDSLWNKKNQIIDTSYGDNRIIFDPKK